MITAIKRQSSLRPLREDNPKFDGSNRLSVPTGRAGERTNAGYGSESEPRYPLLGSRGPWDVDNDNDGVPDSIWIDLGDPVQEAEDGTRYKALVAVMILDMDGRLNVNAHGLADDINPPNLALSYDLNGNPQTLGAAKNLAGQFNSNILSKGLGYGPAEISLRPVFPAPWSDVTGTRSPGNRSETVGPVDSYAAALIGRLKQDGITGVAGKYGFITNENFLTGASFAERATPGRTTSMRRTT